MTTNNELSPEYHNHAQSLEDFRQAIIAATDTQAPIPYDTCLAAWAALIFSFVEMVTITGLADTRIDELQNELGFAYFKELPTAGTA
ncbi:MAG: hypothetical protein JJE30_08895 [Desulfuromonadales bacterium]|nr:hypothetical protein [Desulfuromonadales bacterium]